MIKANYFQGKTVIVTGAGSGIGLEIAKNLHNSGANLILIGRNHKNLEKICNKLSNDDSSLSINFYECDISDNHAINKTFKSIVKHDDKIYGLVNNAGINPSREDLSNTNEKDWQEIIDTNLSGTFNITKATLPLMLKNKSGSIVNISSIAGILGIKRRFSYSVTKSALSGFNKSISIDYAKYKIRSNCICPGYIKTPLTKGYLDSLSKKEYDLLLNKHPLLGLGKESYIADVVNFLLSTKSQWITGSIIPVDGGYSLGRD
jgi:NAD(P)-dependent dehydrogenase (short-subunit alcohol dehydrogenase family)